jgi:hypothetical protein
LGTELDFTTSIVPKFCDFIFDSYGAVQEWLSATLGVAAEDRAVYQMTRYRLKAKLKVARQQHYKPNQDSHLALKKTDAIVRRSPGACVVPSNLASDLKLLSLFDRQNERRLRYFVWRKVREQGREVLRGKLYLFPLISFKLVSIWRIEER